MKTDDKPPKLDTRYYDESMKFLRGGLGARQPWWKIGLGLIAGLIAFSLASVLVHQFAPLPITTLMMKRALEGQAFDYRWRSFSDIDDDLKVAVIAAEDAKFCGHMGFDVEAIEKAQAHNEDSKRKRGASTISQQTAKNAFLWPDRSWVRKGFEAYYTVLIEVIWPKKRILEVYLNIAEWGPGIYGAEAASQHWFGKSAKSLTQAEAARLAAILPSPLKWQAAKAGPYVKKRSSNIRANARVVKREGIAACVID
jgi:monofunctional glycosyltransferase